MSILPIDESTLLAWLTPIEVVDDTVGGSKPSEISRKASGAQGNVVRSV